MSILKNIFNAFRSSRIIRTVKRPPSTPVPPPTPQPIQYLLSDMFTPNLVKPIDPSIKAVGPPFVVKNYKGGGYNRGTLEAVSANCYVTMCNVLNFLPKYSLQEINRWAVVQNLMVNPLAGQNLNAFYNRISLQFFYFSHPSLSSTLFLADSADVVSHELGHAIFDIYRPAGFNAALIEVAGAHEGIADFFSMLNALSYSEVMAYAINQVNGDLRKPNLISGLAEDTGRVINQLTGNRHNVNCLRNAINNYNYVPPSELPVEAPDDQLSSECHSFGKILAGTFYDILVALYEKKLTEDKNPVNALAYARDTLAVLVIWAIRKAPLNVRYYESLAKTILWVDQTKFSGANQQLLKQIFLNRKLISDQIKILSAMPKCNDYTKIKYSKNTLVTKLSDHFIGIQSNNPLYNTSIEIPNDQAIFYDLHGNCMDFTSFSASEAVKGGQEMVRYLHEGNKVNNDPFSQFKIENGKLIRNCFF
jgi:hypothetical protein